MYQLKLWMNRFGNWFAVESVKQAIIRITIGLLNCLEIVNLKIVSWWMKQPFQNIAWLLQNLFLWRSMDLSTIWTVSLIICPSMVLIFFRLTMGRIPKRGHERSGFTGMFCFINRNISSRRGGVWCENCQLCAVVLFLHRSAPPFTENPNKI